MNRVLLDTVGLLALWNRSDQWHVIAKRAMDAAVRSAATEFWTTSFILLECGNAAARRPFRQEVDLLRRQLETQDKLIVPTDIDWQSSWAAYASHEGDAAGIVDCVSFTVMRRLGIRKVFSNDHHFRVAGFETMF